MAELGFEPVNSTAQLFLFYYASPNGLYALEVHFFPLYCIGILQCENHHKKSERKLAYVFCIIQNVEKGSVVTPAGGNSLQWKAARPEEREYR